MNRSLVLKNKVYFYFSFLFTFFLFIYLLYFLVNGDRGILQYFKLNTLNQSYKLELSQLNDDNNYYIDRISRLQPNTIDLDYLDQVYREVTGFYADNEIVVIMD